MIFQKAYKFSHSAREARDHGVKDTEVRPGLIPPKVVLLSGIRWWEGPSHAFAQIE